jgi:CheY-like chemotaxis protein
MAYDLTTTKILIIDDMAPMLTLCKSILNIFGFKNVFLAHNGQEALDLTIRHDPDLIITDWMMKPMDGLEFTREVRKNPLCPNPYVPIIMMPGFSSKLRVESARDCGITEFLVKPFTSRDLYNRIVQIIEKPRQFVDAEDFFGPDRRRRNIKDYEGPQRRDDDSVTKEQSKAQSSSAQLLQKLRDEAKNLSKK